MDQVNLDSSLMNISSMVLLNASLSYSLLRKNQSDLSSLLMIGMTLGTFFGNISTFLQVIMDSNEYDLLQGKLFASFGNVDSQYLIFVNVVVLITCGISWRKSYRLDALHLENHQARDLGITVNQFRLVSLCLIGNLVGSLTALVGPIISLGFIVANVSYQFMKTYRYQELFMAGSLIAVFLLVFGQLMVEQAFHLNTPLSVVIQFVGGIYSIWKTIAEGKQRA